MKILSQYRPKNALTIFGACLISPLAMLAMVDQLSNSGEPIQSAAATERPSAGKPRESDGSRNSLPNNPDLFAYFDTTVFTGFLEQTVDLNHDLVRNRIPDLSAAMYGGDTNIGGGMRVGIEDLVANPNSDPNAQQMMIVLTDGNANLVEAPGTTPDNSIDHYAAVAAGQGIIVHGVTVGDGASRTPIQNAATTTGGIYRHVPDDDLEGMLEAFEEIGLNGGHAKLVR